MRELQIQIADLQAENRALRRRLPMLADMRYLRQAYRDAHAMLLRRYAGYSVSRAACARDGSISERRWSLAVALLKAAGLHNGYDMLPLEQHVALARLRVEFDEMEAAGNAARLRQFVIPSRRWCQNR